MLNNKVDSSLKVSVIVPVYNVEKYLERCLNSILNQTYKNLEIICVNDGSTDKSLCILEKFASDDNRFKIINKSNGGLSSARNAGLAIASGQFAFFLDSDDWIDKETIFDMLDKAVTYNVDSVVCNVINIPENNSCIPICKSNQAWVNSYLKEEGTYFLSKNLKKELLSLSCNKLYKMDIIRKYNVKFPVGIIHEDEVFLWAYFIHTSKYYFIPKNYYNYFRHKDSIMGQKNNSLRTLDIFVVHEFIYDIVLKYKDIKDYKFILALNYIVSINKFFSETKEEYKEKALELIKKYELEINKNNILIKIYYFGNKYPLFLYFCTKILKVLNYFLKLQ